MVVDAFVPLRENFLGPCQHAGLGTKLGDLTAFLLVHCTLRSQFVDILLELFKTY